jgi:hypothetical protein
MYCIRTYLLLILQAISGDYKPWPLAIANALFSVHALSFDEIICHFLIFIIICYIFLCILPSTLNLKLTLLNTLTLYTYIHTYNTEYIYYALMRNDTWYIFYVQYVCTYIYMYYVVMSCVCTYITYIHTVC